MDHFSSEKDEYQANKRNPETLSFDRITNSDSFFWSLDKSRFHIPFLYNGHPNSSTVVFTVKKRPSFTSLREYRCRTEPLSTYYNLTIVLTCTELNRHTPRSWRWVWACFLFTGFWRFIFISRTILEIEIVHGHYRKRRCSDRRLYGRWPGSFTNNGLIHRLLWLEESFWRNRADG